MKKIKHTDHQIKVSAVKAVLKGISVIEVSKLYDRNRATIYTWLNKYHEKNRSACLKTKKRSGRPRKFDQVNLSQIKEDLLRPASKFGFETDFWTSRRLVQHLKKNFKLNVSMPTMWRRLREAKLTYQKPERRYYETDIKEQNNWLKKILPKIKIAQKKFKAILYFEDESNIRLTPVIGKTWAPRGKTPLRKGTGNRGSIAAMSAISSSGNLLFTLHQEKITSVEVILFLKQMLDHHPKRHLIVVMDQAKTHVSDIVKIFVENQKRLHVFYLPTRSPKLNPDEYVWNHLKNEELKDHQAKTIKDLQKASREKLHKMSKDPRLIRGIFFRCKHAKIYL